MREQRPSRTASEVAFARAIGALGVGAVEPYDDPMAALLPAPFRTLHRLVKTAARYPTRRVVERFFADRIVDMLQLRARLIDEAVNDAMARGVRQLVILGAGLDGRAYRLSALREAVVFEVDHPATQAYKERRVADLPRTAKDVRFTAVDFEREGIEAPLAAAAHTPSEPTFWIWEGVIAYLTLSALRSTLRDIARLSAPGSQLIFDYREPRALPDRARRQREQRLRRDGEPIVGLYTQEEMTDEVTRAGFRVEFDKSADDWGKLYARRTPLCAGDTATRAMLCSTTTRRPAPAG